MKELDFDELDRAVNSLMTKTDEPQLSSQDEAQTTSLSTGDIIPESLDDVAPASNTSELATTSPSLATKRSGRFMDMMPASATTKTSRPIKPSHTGPVLKPINDVVNPEPTNPSLELDQQAQPSILSETEPSTTDNVVAHSWPDPIDVHEQQTTVVDEPSGAEVAAPTDEAKPVIEAEQPSTLAATDSPFLTDAKVEKRPLDALAPLNGSDGEAVPVETDIEAQTTPQVMPAELGEELLAIESDSRLTEEAEPAEAVQEKAAVRKNTPVESDTVSLATPETKTIDDRPETKPTVGAMSINQQYKVAESTRDQSHTALYDNAAEPLQHPPKQKSTWPIILLILLLILVGAGGAAALYFLKLI